jgi:lipid-A-disaccharide synthase
MSKCMRIGLLAGEMSGDLLGASLMRALRQRVPDIVFEGIGGPRMTAEGLESRVAMERLSVMGFVEPLKRLPELLRIRADILAHFQQNPPDVFIGIDSPDFNLGIEQRLKNSGIPSVHYVSPSVWAWRQGRIRGIARAVDLMLTLLPFEAEFYQQHDVPVVFTGHPLADEIPTHVDPMAARQQLGLAPQEPILALLPGSRQGEVGRLAPPFLMTALHCQQQRPGLQVLVPCVSPARRQQVEHAVAIHAPGLRLKILDGESRLAMTAADVLLIASGTATLEGLLLKKPMIVCYKLPALTYALVRRMVKIPHFSLPNLLAGAAIVPEYVQQAVEPVRLSNEIGMMLDHADNRQVQVDAYRRIHEQLRRHASDRAADAILALQQERRG